MRRILVAVVFFLSFSVSAQVEKHAPTADVCRADLAVWSNAELRTNYYQAEKESLKTNSRNRDEIASLPVKEIRGRMLEMQTCGKVDPTNFDSYDKAADFYYNVQANRWYKFLLRHNLFDQFEREDAAGKR